MGTRSGIRVKLALGVLVLFPLAESIARVAIGLHWANPPSDLAGTAGPLPAEADYIDRFLDGLRRSDAALPTPTREDLDTLWANQPASSSMARTPGTGDVASRSWRVDIDAAGNRAVAAPASRDGVRPYRVLCLGDSVTFGSSVDQPLTYPQQLREILSQRIPDRSIEVVNGGVQMWTWPQGARGLERQFQAGRFDAVVAGFGTNDQALWVHETDAERLTERRRVGTRVAFYLRPWLGWSAIFRLVEPRLDPTIVVRRDPSPACVAPTRARLGCRRASPEQIGTAIDEIATRTRAAGTDLLVINTDFTDSPAVAASRGACERANIPYLDLAERVRDWAKGQAREAARERGLASPEEVSLAPPATVILRAVALGAAMPTRASGATGRLLAAAQGPPRLVDPRDFSIDLHDDGTGVDERAGDGVWSGAVAIPPEHDVIEYGFLDGPNPEFGKAGSGPASRPALWRRRTTVGGHLGPIDRFGKLAGLSDPLHPDAEGAAVIAALVADALERLPSWPRVQPAVPFD